VPQPWHSTLFAIAAVSVGCIFNTFFARKLPLIETLMLVLHILGFFAILIPLWVLAPKAPSSEVWSGLQNNAGWSSLGLSFLVGITSPVNALLGSDAVVHMAEEVRDASRTLPLAMVWTLVLNGIMGLIMSVTFAYCLGPLQASISPPYFFAFIGTFYTATNSHAGATVMSCIITIMTLCSAITNVATGSRQMFAFARDNGLPFSKFLCYVRPGWDIPLNAVLVSFTIAALLSLINLGSSVAFNAILSIGVVSLLTSYLVSISCILYKRIRRRPLLERRWSLGRYGLPLNIISVAYLLIAWLFAFFPLGTPVTVETMVSFPSETLLNPLLVLTTSFAELGCCCLRWRGHRCVYILCSVRTPDIHFTSYSSIKGALRLEKA
jgi:choline transport protein